MNERIKELRNSLHMTQTEFAKETGKTRDSISNLELGRVSPDNTFVELVCRKFGVNEVWLRTGVGEMKLPMPLDQQLAQIFADVQISDDERARLVKAFASLPPEAYPQLYKWFLTLMENLGK